MRACQSGHPQNPLTTRTHKNARPRRRAQNKPLDRTRRRRQRLSVPSKSRKTPKLDWPNWKPRSETAFDKKPLKLMLWQRQRQPLSTLTPCSKSPPSFSVPPPSSSWWQFCWESSCDRVTTRTTTRTTTVPSPVFPSSSRKIPGPPWTLFENGALSVVVSTTGRLDLAAPIQRREDWKGSILIR